jgi:PAS domain S-box-containing protein
MVSEKLLEFLQEIPIFSRLDRGGLGRIAPLLKERTYRSGQLLFRENTFGDRLYIIIEGEIEIAKTENPGEKSTRLALRRKGDIFGEMSLLDEEPRFASAKAIKDTRALELSKQDFLAMLVEHPLIGYQVMRILSSRLRQSDLHLVDELRKKNKQLAEAYNNLKAYAEALTMSNRELNQAKTFLERIISTSPYSIVVSKPDHTIFLFNQTAEGEYGYGSQEVMGKKVEMLRGGANLLNLDQLIEEALQQKGIWQGEIIARRKDGEHFVSHTVITSVLDEAANTSAILHITKNITFEKNLSRQALELERMATRGEMAAEVAHELNNYLQIVLGNLDLLSCEATTGGEACFEKRMPVIKSELEKIGCFINNLMDFAVPQSVKKPVDLVNFIEKELFFLRPQNRFDDIVFETYFDQKLPLVEVDQGQVQQLFYNLMNNAADALKPVTDRKKTIGVAVRYLAEKKEAEIEVRDNGVGISKDNLSKVFKERFTTKERGHGFGLLSVRRAVENHEGLVGAESQEEVGTTFAARIPIKQSDPDRSRRLSSEQPTVCQGK